MNESPTYQLVTPLEVPVREQALPPEKKLIEVVRVYPLVKRSVSELKRNLESGVQPEDINFFNVIFMEKNDESTTSPHYLTPIGGIIETNQSPAREAYNNLMRKTTHFPVEFPLKETLDKIPHHSTDTFTYQIAGSADKRPRRVHAAVIEVTELEGRKPEIINASEQAKKLVSETSSEAIQLIQGSPMGNLIGSSHFGPAEDITIKPHQLQRKNNLLRGLNHVISQKEEHFKKRLLAKINAQRRSDITSSAKKDDEIVTVTFANPLRQKKREIYRNETTSRQVDVLLRLNDATPEEIINAFNHLKKQDMMRTFREIEAKRERVHLNKATPPFEQDLGPNLGKDLLYYAQIFAGREGEDFTSLAAKTDRATIRTLRLMRDVLRTSLTQLFEENPDISYALYPQGHADLFNLNNDLTKSYQEKQELSREVMEPIKELYLKKDKDSVKQQLILEEKLSRIIVRNLAYHFDLNPGDVMEIKKEANRMQKELIDAALSTDPEFANIYQLHRTLNEVQNANFAQLMFLNLGVLPDEVVPGVMQLTRFEAARLTVQILKGLTGFRHHAELTKDESVTLFQKLITNVYGPVVRQEQVDLEFKGDIIKQTFLYRRGPQGIEVIVDEKDKKSLLSYIRKSFEEKHEAIFDGVAFNVALAPDDIELTHDHAGSTIRRMDKLIKRFHDTAVDLYQDDYDISLRDDKNTYQNLLTYLLQRESGQPITADKDGKRAGSIGNSIIRRKFILELKNKQTGISAYCEFVFYPFAELATKTDGEFLGLNEKLVDAKAYEFRRVTTSLDANRVGFPSGYELMNPPQIYEHAVTVYEHHRKEDRKKRS